jgi:hypothetical protein
MFCERFGDEVLLSCGDLNQVRWVPALLRAAGNDVDAAARLVVDGEAVQS